MRVVPTQAKHKGLTLIEVLIALLVLSIGLIGLALLHTNSLKFAHSSYFTSVASTVALDLEERLWIALGSQEEGCLELADVTQVIGDLQIWNDASSQRVAIPRLTITPRQVISVSDSFTEVPITLSWPDERFDAGETTLSFSARVVCAETESGEEAENGNGE